MVKRNGNLGGFLNSAFKNIADFFFFKKIIEKKKRKKSVIRENLSASKNKPELIKLLDESSARKTNNNPESIYDAIADMIVKNIVEDMKKKDKCIIKGITDFIDEAEESFLKLDEEDLHKNRINIKEKLKNEYYGSLLTDNKEQSKKGEKKKKDKKNK